MISPSSESRSAPTLAVGIDLVRIGEVAQALARFGERYETRLFTAGEIGYCRAGATPAVQAERFAARFAAKEAAFKALDWGDRPTDWREIEVVRRSDGGPRLALHGRARDRAEACGLESLSVSLSHERDYATAIVTGIGGHASERKATPMTGVNSD